MRHAIGYMGRVERSLGALRPGVQTYVRADGTFGTVDGRPADVDGVFFGFMEATGKKFFAVRAQYGSSDIVVKTPVLIVPAKHTDGKGFGPQNSRFGDKSAQQLLTDLIEKNPGQAADLHKISVELGWEVAAEIGLKSGETPSTNKMRASQVKASTWRDQVSTWSKKRRFSDRDIDTLIAYFERAFSNTRPQCFSRAWFGTHPSTASLVVGGIFLASIYHHSGEDRGLWLLLDMDAAQLDGVDYRPVKSTRKSLHKLRWAHAGSIDALAAIVENDAMWESFSRATEKILSSPIAADRDAVQEKRGKVRLADFWPEDDDEQSEIPVASVVPLGSQTASAKEGQLRQRQFWHRHREQSLRIAKIEHARSTHSNRRLICQVPRCGFDFEAVYGELGLGYAEVHHRVQLSALEPGSVTTLEDLLVVCSNCHRMIHRGGACREISTLIPHR